MFVNAQAAHLCLLTVTVRQKDDKDDCFDCFESLGGVIAR